MISIGIAAYNEENNIKECLNYLNEQLSKIGLLKKTEIIVCLNGCTDKTEKIVKKFQKNYSNNLKIVYAKKGKLNAHKKITENINHENIIFFCDADVLIPGKSILTILEEFKKNKKVKIVSAYPYALESNKTKLHQKIIYNVLNLKRIHPKIEVAKRDVSKFHENIKDQFLKRSRIYFHGRFFGIKNKGTYKFPKEGSRIRGDDTFLTRAVLSKFGPGSIKVLFDSPVYCVPLYSVKEHLNSEYRIKKDIDMIKKEYPEFKEINNHIEMTLNWEHYKTLNMKNKFYTLLFFLLISYEKYSYFLVRNFIDLDTIWSYDNKEGIKNYKK